MASDRDTRAWVVRAGDKDETYRHNLDHNVVTYHWEKLRDLRTYLNNEELDGDIDFFGEMDGNRHKIGSHRGQLLKFRDEIRDGHVVVLPPNRHTKRNSIAIGTVTGAYGFDAAQTAGARHRIPVQWLITGLDKSKLERDLLKSVQCRGTVREIGANNAPTRLLEIASPSMSGEEAGALALEAGSVPEGAITHAEVLRYERSSAARAACLQHYGHRCQVCDLDFEERYGELGRGYMHVHHIVPLHKVAGIPNYRVDPVEDLRPVCPNCHAMLHRPKDRTPTVEELRDIRRLLR